MKSWYYLVMVILISIGMVQCKSEKEKIKSKTLQEVKPGQSTADGKVSLTDDEMDHAKKIYFQTCAGCHGTSRNGATGPSLLPEKRTLMLGT